MVCCGIILFKHAFYGKSASNPLNKFIKMEQNKVKDIDSLESFRAKIKLNRKNKKHSREELMKLSQEELVDRIIQMEAHNVQLKNIIQKNLDNKTIPEEDFTNSRKFDFSKCNKRHALLKIYYLGWNYQGFATQEDSIETIEHHLFNALVKTCLIENRQNSNYHRCGRTDKGVSAFCQAISIDLRSKFPVEEQLTKYAIKNELEYCVMLNRVLPADIRVIAWMAMDDPNYSARFDCYERTYRYFFPRGDLNIEAMQAACENLKGIHDFRNLCKMDVANGVTTFTREIRNAEICLSAEDTLIESNDSSYDMFYFELTGKAFLWHQVRCIVAVLVLVGQGNEDPSVITELFDVEKNPCKPQYSLASDQPLNLYICKFRSISQHYVGPEERDMDTLEQFDIFGYLGENEHELIQWNYDKHNFDLIFVKLQQQWAAESIRCSMMREMLKDLKNIYKTITTNEEKHNQANILLQGVRAKEYQKLLERKKCKSLENRIEHYVKKRRLDVVNENDSKANC